MKAILISILAIVLAITSNPHREPEKKNDNSGYCTTVRCVGKVNVHN